eukprot:s729_g14.t1
MASHRSDPSDRGRPETREPREPREVGVALRPASLSVQDVTQSSINSASVSSSIFSLHRDVKGVSDAQARLVRVIEDVSQDERELHQRLSQHDQQLDQLAEKQETLQERELLTRISWNFYRDFVVQKDEKAWRQSLDAEYLRLRTLDGNFQTQMNYLESKIGQLEKCFTDLRGRSNWSLESQGQSRMQRQIEDLRGEFRGNLETLEARLSGTLSHQLQSQLMEIVQQQLQQHVQPQLQQQLQQQLKDVHVLEVQRLCEEQVKQLEQRLFSGQETLRKEALKREQHLAELQDAAQRLAQTAMQRAQASTEAHAQVFSASSSLGQRLQLVEKEVQSLQRHEKERHKRRILRLEEDLAGAEEGATAASAAAPSTSAIVSPGSSKREFPEASTADLLRIDELRVQLYTELSDARHVTTQLSGRVARCEAEILDLRQVMNAAAMEAGSHSSPATPEWPSPWQVASKTEEPLLQRNGNALPALPSPPSPAPAPPMGIDAAGPSSHSRLLQGMPEGPQLSSWDGEKAMTRPDSSGVGPALQESPPRTSQRFGVLPPPKVTPAVEPATL